MKFNYTIPLCLPIMLVLLYQVTAKVSCWNCVYFWLTLDANFEVSLIVDWDSNCVVLEFASFSKMKTLTTAVDLPQLFMLPLQNWCRASINYKATWVREVENKWFAASSFLKQKVVHHFPIRLWHKYHSIRSRSSRPINNKTNIAIKHNLSQNNSHIKLMLHIKVMYMV